MAAKHSSKLRGLDAAGHARKLEGARFGRLFPDLPAATYGTNHSESEAILGTLAKAMVSNDPPKDGPDDEESGIPSLYTYFGQFIDHDLTFDPSSSFQKQKDPQAKEDFRTPAFDLDNVYGRGPGDQPYLYDSDGKSFILGEPLSMGSDPDARDLQRNSGGRALIGDPRNDENVIVSQFQGLMLRFHNGMVRANPNLSFDQVQQLVRFHYQYVVITDFLERIVNRSVLDDLKTNGQYDPSKIRFFTNFAGPFNEPYMPLEFSVAAYRLGHSMVRPGYRLNDTVLLPIFPLPDGDPENGVPPMPEGLTGFRRMISDWGIDWGRFIDVDKRDYGDQPQGVIAANRRLQFAYRIDTSLVEPLGHLPQSVVSNPPLSLAHRNLLRALEFGLPSGQTVAKHMQDVLGAAKVPILDDNQILIGADVDQPKPQLSNIVEVGGAAFTSNCPLWVYVLAEAMQNHAKPDPEVPVKPKRFTSTPQLGPVGGRIVAEVFLGIMFADPGSYLSSQPGWNPGGAGFRLKHFVEEALAN